MSNDKRDEFAESMKVVEAFAKVTGLPVASEISLDAVVGDRAGGPSLTFDVNKYLAYLKGSDLSDAQKKELLESVWHIVVGFVEFGYGSHPIQQAMDNSRIIDGIATEVVVDSRSNHSGSNKNSDGTRPRGGSRERGIHEPS